MGNSTSTDGDLDSDGQSTVARLMLILVTINRPLPEFTPLVISTICVGPHILLVFLELA